MKSQPASGESSYAGCGKVRGKTALITGGDTAIGRAVAIAFAKEGADVSIVYLNEHGDANATKQKVEDAGRRCLLIAGDVGDEAFCRHAVEQTVGTFRQLDIVVNNAAEQDPQESIAKISRRQLERIFRTNILSMFYLTQAARPYLTQIASLILAPARLTAAVHSSSIIRRQKPRSSRLLDRSPGQRRLPTRRNSEGTRP